MNELSSRPVMDSGVDMAPTTSAQESAQWASLRGSAAASQTLQGLLTPGLRSIQRAHAHPYELMLAEVQGVDEEGYIVVNLQSGVRVKSSVAVGCLVEPQKGDLVQVFANRLGGWITMVLRRAESSTPLRLTANGRGIELSASTLTLEASERMTLQAPRLEERATLKDVVNQERSTTVLGTDNLQTGNASWNVEGHLGMHSQTQLMTAESLMKINGGQIHMA